MWHHGVPHPKASSPWPCEWLPELCFIILVPLPPQLPQTCECLDFSRAYAQGSRVCECVCAHKHVCVCRRAVKSPIFSFKAPPYRAPFGLGSVPIPLCVWDWHRPWHKVASEHPEGINEISRKLGWARTPSAAMATTAWRTQSSLGPAEELEG